MANKYSREMIVGVSLSFFAGSFLSYLKGERGVLLVSVEEFPLVAARQHPLVRCPEVPASLHAK